MRQLVPIFAALSIAAAPALAQEKVTRLDYGFSYVIPQGYRVDPHFSEIGLFGETLIDLQTKEGILKNTTQGTNAFINHFVVSSITLTSQPLEKVIVTPEGTKPVGGETPDAEKKRITSASKNLVQNLNSIFRLANVTMDYQNSASIKVSGEDAIAVRCNSYVGDSDIEFTVRLIFMIRKDKLLTFLFAAKNTDFEEEVKPFDAFMRNFKFLTPPGAKPKPTLAPPKPKKKK